MAEEEAGVAAKVGDEVVEVVVDILLLFEKTAAPVEESNLTV